MKRKTETHDWYSLLSLFPLLAILFHSFPPPFFFHWLITHFLPLSISPPLYYVTLFHLHFPLTLPDYLSFFINSFSSSHSVLFSLYYRSTLPNSSFFFYLFFFLIPFLFYSPFSLFFCIFISPFFLSTSVRFSYSPFLSLLSYIYLSIPSLSLFLLASSFTLSFPYFSFSSSSFTYSIPHLLPACSHFFPPLPFLMIFFAAFSIFLFLLFSLIYFLLSLSFLLPSSLPLFFHSYFFLPTSSLLFTSIPFPSPSIFLPTPLPLPLLFYLPPSLYWPRTVTLKR